MESTAARAMCAMLVLRVRPMIVPRAYGSQYGAPRPTNAGTRYTPSESGTVAASGLHLGRAADRLQPVAQPLHHRARDEHRPFQAVRHLAAHHPADGGEQAVLGRARLAAGVQQQEAAGAVGVLRAARLEAGLAEGRRLLVAGRGRDLDRAAEDLGVGLAVHLGGLAHRGQHPARHVEDPQQLVVPVEGVDVEHQRAAGVAHVGDVGAAAGEPPDEEACRRCRTGCRPPPRGRAGRGWCPAGA